MTPFEVSVVAAYFLVMALLSFHGLHRLILIRRYYRFADRAPKRPSRRFQCLPKVTVQLPVYNERYVVEDLIRSVCRLDYPRHLLEIQVLDDSTDDTVHVARRVVEQMAARGHLITHLHRHDRSGYKAGALQAGLERSTGEFIAIFDADFSPDRDYLRSVIHYFREPEVGAVQARWTYRNRNHSLLTRIQGILLDGHFIYEHGGRARAGLFFNFNGTAGILRRSMIEDAGGWSHDTLTEDSDLSYRAQLRGWKFVYLPHVEVASELPVDIASFHAQQARWAKGLTQTGIKLLPTIFRAKLPLAVKIEALVHLMANVSYPLMVLLSVLVLPTAIIRAEEWTSVNLLDLPIFLGTFLSLGAFYVGSQAELATGTWRRTVWMIPALMAIGIGMTLSNTRAVIEALLGIQSPFQRTAKYSSNESVATLARQRYSLGKNRLCVANLMLGAYFGVAVLYSLLQENWPTAPFLMIFCLGYLYSGVVTLLQAQGRHSARPSLEILGLRENRARSPIVTS